MPWPHVCFQRTTVVAVTRWRHVAFVTFSRGVSGLEQGENRGGGEEILDSAYVLKAQPTGLVKGYKMFSLSGQIVNVRPCRPHSLCCSCSALLLKHK